MKKISEHITYAEAIHSNTAKDANRQHSRQRSDRVHENYR